MFNKLVASVGVAVALVGCSQTSLVSDDTIPKGVYCMGEESGNGFASVLQHCYDFKGKESVVMTTEVKTFGKINKREDLLGYKIEHGFLTLKKNGMPDESYKIEHIDKKSIKILYNDGQVRTYHKVDEKK